MIGLEQSLGSRTNAAGSANRGSAPRILVVEDEALVAEDTSLTLQRMGYAVVGIAAGAQECLELARTHRPDLVLMDIVIQGAQDGIETADALRRALDLPVVFVTSHSDEATFHRAKIDNAFGYVLKPIAERELQMAIEIGLFRKKMESEMAASRRLLEITLQSLGEGVVVVDPAGIIRTINRTAEEMTGWRCEEIAGRSLRDVVALLDPADDSPGGSRVLQALETARISRSDGCRVMVTNGRRLLVEETGAPIKDDSGAVVGGVLVFRDVSERQRHEQQREALVGELRHALSQVKTLHGLLPVCAWCRKVRGDDGYWQQLEEYIVEHSEASVTHGICPDCARQLEKRSEH